MSFQMFLQSSFKNFLSIFVLKVRLKFFFVKNPLDFIDKFMDQFKAPQNLDLPRFSGGLAGYFGYETIQYIEPRLSKEFLEDKLDLPDILLMLSDEVVVFDNVSGKLYFVTITPVKIICVLQNKAPNTTKVSPNLTVAS